jgi:hypothetical protein
MINTELQYRTFDELMADVYTDFEQYNLENMINPQQLIRVVTRVNDDLGLAINKTKDAVIDICNHKGRLPVDFQILNHMYVCGKYSVTETVPSGTHIEDVVLTPSDCKVPKVYYYAIDYNPVSSSLCATDCFATSLGRDAVFGLVSYFPLSAGDTVYIQLSNNTGLCVELVGSGFNETPNASYPTSIFGPQSPGQIWKVYNVLQKHSDCAACKQRHNQNNNTIPNCGDPIQNVAPVEKQPNDSPFCMPQDACMNKCGDYYQLIQKTKYTTKTFTEFFKVRLKPGRSISCDCPNTKIKDGPYAEIKDGFIHTGFETGTMYINYEAIMQDDDGNLIVLDRPLINEYYEYAIKERILENLLMNGEDVVQKINYIAQKLRIARVNALSIVRTPNFADMKKVWVTNRKVMWYKYFDLIQ